MDENSPKPDAEKIRQRRLQKLGTNSSTPSAHAADSELPETHAEPNRPAQPTETPASLAASRSVSSPVPPAKRESNGSKRTPSRHDSSSKTPEAMESWQDRSLRKTFRVSFDQHDGRDAHGNSLIYLSSTREDLEEANKPLVMNVDLLDGAITEAASNTPNGKPFEYLLGCFKRASQQLRAHRSNEQNDPKHTILKETKRLCMSYCIFAITMPEMYSESVPTLNSLADHLLEDPESELGIDTDFLTEASNRFEEDGSIKDIIIHAAEQLSQRMTLKSMLDDYQSYMQGIRNLVRFPKFAGAITQSSMWLPENVSPQDIENSTLLGPFFRLSPMQSPVAQSYFSAPKTRDRTFIANAHNAVRVSLRAHQTELFQIVDTIVRSGQMQREHMLDWFAICVNKNHKKRAIRVDRKTVSTDGFMVNVTSVLDQLCEPFMDARFGKIDRIDVDYLRRRPRVEISDETKINADQKTADEFYSVQKEGASNFISEVFFLTVAAHHYGTEAAQESVSTLRKIVERMETDLEQVESERPKYVHDTRYLQRFEDHVHRFKKRIDETWSTIHATNGVLLDDLMQTRTMQFMRYVIVWLLRLASYQDLPARPLCIPLAAEEPEVFKVLPEYFLEGVVDNFKFITRNIPHIITTQQAEEIVQICITFLRNSEYVKNPGVKSGLVTILFYGSHAFGNRSTGVLGDILIGSEFANKHLLHALLKFYIEAESTGTHTQFFDKFNIRFEIFQVIQVIWKNPLYRENLGKEARSNTDFFVQFVNLLLNDVTFVLDESLSSFTKIHDLSKELADQALMAGLDEEQRKEKAELLEDHKGRAKSYMQLTRETMEMLKLFSESLADSFTMPEIVTRLADMLDYNLDTMVGPKRSNLRVENPQEYGFNPLALLADMITVYCNLATKKRFVEAIAKDGRSYKPHNFVEATQVMRSRLLKSPEELHVWDKLAEDVAAAKAVDEEEEADLGDTPDEFMDPLVFDLMKDPVLLPASKTIVDRSTIRSHLLSDPTDPFNRAPLKIEDVIPDAELKARIEAWKAEKKAARRTEKMDTTQG